MKILHTSDWHIGKKLAGRDRYDEYRAVLAEIRNLCESEKIDLVLVAGDVYDTYTPSAEAEEIFYSGIKEIAKESAALIISGNHDDYVRLTAASAFAEEMNVYIVGNNFTGLSCKKRGKVYPVKSGAGYALFANDAGERLYVNILPYPNEARFKEGKSDETFNEKMTRWIQLGESGKDGEIPSVFLSHIFVSGGKASDSEREIDLGGARLTPLNILPNCQYCALGHLHKRQSIGGKAHYCGAPMQFSFDEAGDEKSVNIFNIGADGVTDFKVVPITSAKKLIRLQANGVLPSLKLLEDNLNCYVELTLNVNEPLTLQDSSLLRSSSNLITLKVNVAARDGAEVRKSNKNKSAKELFCEYYKNNYGGEPKSELLELFLSLTEEE